MCLQGLLIGYTFVKPWKNTSAASFLSFPQSNGSDLQKAEKLLYNALLKVTHQQAHRNTSSFSTKYKQFLGQLFSPFSKSWINVTAVNFLSLLSFFVITAENTAFIVLFCLGRRDNNHLAETELSLSPEYIKISLWNKFLKQASLKKRSKRA